MYDNNDIRFRHIAGCQGFELSKFLMVNLCCVGTSTARFTSTLIFNVLRMKLKSLCLPVRSRSDPEIATST